MAAFRAQKVIKVGVCVTAPFLRIGKPDVMERENSAFKDGKPGLGGGKSRAFGKMNGCFREKEGSVCSKRRLHFPKMLICFQNIS